MTLHTESFVLNIGPSHPSTHGVFRMKATMEGEVINDLEPVFGYLHRGIEKLCEERTYIGIIPLTDRLDYVASMSNNMAFVMAAEKLGGIKAPERAEYIRVIMAELQRIASHLVSVGSFLNDCGAFMTPFLYTLREREKILDLFDMVSGQRLTYNYMRVGGVNADLPEAFLPALKIFIDRMPSYIDEYDQLLKENEILIARTRGVGVLSRELAINASTAGPVLRASGVNWDLRKNDPYSVYDRFQFDVPTGENGDNYDRYRVRIEEMRQSVRILKQAAGQIPDGPVMAEGMGGRLLRLPVGEAYGRVEGPKGELGFYIVSDGSIAPYRCRIRAPSFLNLTALREMVVGWKIADAIATFGSIDICMGEVDR
jgi:NADH-quinone oxidoreductase subunit D